MQSDSRKSSENSSDSDLIFEDFFKDIKNDEISEQKNSSASANLENSQKSSSDSSSTDADDDGDEIIYVPDNPKKWSEADISTWIKWTTKKFNLGLSIDIAKFPRTAEELANFTKAEFYIACGSFEGGEKVAQHYKYLMENVNEEFHETLKSDSEPGQLELSNKSINVYKNCVA